MGSLYELFINGRFRTFDLSKISSLSSPCEKTGEENPYERLPGSSGFSFRTADIEIVYEPTGRREVICFMRRDDAMSAYANLKNAWEAYKAVK